MSTKLKALGLGILAMLAMGVFAAINATAETGGHFTSGSTNTTIVAAETDTHSLELGVEGLTPIVCTDATYHGSMGLTETELTITPSYNECITNGSTVHNFVVHENDCDYVFKIGATAADQDNTIDLVCPSEEDGIEVTHDGCVIILPEQTLEAATYTTKVNGEGVHDITVDFDFTGMTAHFEAGFCTLLGTNHGASLTGSVTVEGRNAANEPVDVTAVGSTESETSCAR